jgi:methylated-DNA-[protein]-cysteine S-methyltransferase
LTDTISAPAFEDVAPGTVALGQVPTPIGEFSAAVTSDGLACLIFPGDAPSMLDAWRQRWMPDGEVVSAPSALRRVSDELTAYFEGTLRRFSLPVAPHGTPFRVRVWQALKDIPYGETRSYGDVARAIGAPRAVRAVGAANGANPVPIILPCHRVIGSNGRLTGYGGGLPLKERLLALEGVHLPF